MFDVNLAAINVPALIVSHANDSCSLSPASDDTKLQAALAGAPQAKAIRMTGGKPAASAPCEAESPHGFYGVEVDAIKHMVSWIAAH